MIRVGDVVRYDHPDWGPCRGRVLAVEGDRVLVQDLAPNGARERWPAAKVRTDGTNEGGE